MRLIQNLSYSTLLFIVLLQFLTCQKKEVQKEHIVPANSDHVAASPHAESEWWIDSKIKHDNEEQYAEIKVSNSTAAIEYGTRHIKGITKNGKRIYTDDVDGSVLYEAKLQPGKVKIRTADGTLLWKCTLKEGKINLYRTEDGETDFSLKFKDGRVKVKSGEETIGKVAFYSDKEKIKVKDTAGNTRFKINAQALSASYGILLIDVIPPEVQLIIAVEILIAGM